MPVPFLIAGRIQNVQTCLFGVFAVQDRQPLEQQVRIINHLAGAAGHDAGGQAAGGNHGQRLAKFGFHAGSQAVPGTPAVVLLPQRPLQVARD